ncbi:MAG: hypothetical protein AAF449_16600, partial [Myxococcota bacterium]
DALPISPHTATSELLDGRTFYIDSVDENGASMGQEYLRFEQGRVEGSLCRTYGFAAVAYSASKGDKKTTFTADMKSEKEGRMVWKGVIHADRIEGTTLWSKAGQRTIKIRFSGKPVTRVPKKVFSD